MPQANSNSVRASIEATGKVPKPGYSRGNFAFTLRSAGHADLICFPYPRTGQNTHRAPAQTICSCERGESVQLRFWWL